MVCDSNGEHSPAILPTRRLINAWRLSLNDQECCYRRKLCVALGSFLFRQLAKLLLVKFILVVGQLNQGNVLWGWWSFMHASQVMHIMQLDTDLSIPHVIFSNFSRKKHLYCNIWLTQCEASFLFISSFSGYESLTLLPLTLIRFCRFLVWSLTVNNDVMC